jgi:hypothetical protein
VFRKKNINSLSAVSFVNRRKRGRKIVGVVERGSNGTAEVAILFLVGRGDRKSISL